ncbi:hypothetical protein L211DRAFT_854212 [Terfezia boudieri ATCC MYA-4762]|uniref:Uncharacterized protein n=1 Tax=Terfezia boudieri ATCC MYA-4762 TaxID=1051890 RepID=A0A3N4L613_9PEZI|nr:hypothetical protein L211DRAFT_854212 [Terfezia boudieri ATCC MYA-4762]
MSISLPSQQLTRIENATNRIVNNARTLDAEIETQWAKYKGPRRWALMEKVFEHVQLKGEESSHAAYALKKHLDACTDQDFQEMGKTRQEAEQAFQLLETLTPMATQHTQSEVRKAISRGKLTTAWSVDWEDKLEDIMPPFPAKKFLQVLAKYAEENSDISAATKYFKGRIDLHMHTKKTKKNPHLMLRDIADEAATKKSRQKGKKAAH